jgi:ketosteroid isomerase-like protein
MTNMDGLRLRELFATIDARRWDALAEFFHPDIVYERPGTPPLRGLDRVLLYYREERQIISSAHTVEGALVQDGSGAAWGRVDCVLTAGTRNELGFADIYLIEQELIRLRRTHFFLPGV